MAKRKPKRTPKKNAASTWTALGKATGFSVAAIRGWRKLPGAPTTPDVEAWKAFIVANDLGSAGNRIGHSREHWLVEKLKKEVILQDIRIARERRELLPIEDVAVFVANLGFATSQWAYRIARELPRQIIGDSLDEAQDKAEAYAVSMVSELRDRVAAWWPKDRTPPDINNGDS